MIGNAMAMGLLAALAWYAFLRRATYNLLDPLILVGVFVAMSATFLTALCDDGAVTWDKLGLFWAVLLGYLAGMWLASNALRLQTLRDAINGAVAQFTRREIIAILALACLTTLVLGVLGVGLGAEGDARQDFQRTFRPLVVLQSGLFLFALVLLLSRRLSVLQVVTSLVALVVFSIPFSGKSILVPVVYFYGLRVFVSGHRPTLRAVFGMAFVALLGVALMALIAYQANGLLGVLAIIGSRFWASGDVYVFAYQAHALDAIRNNFHVSFLAYMLHPVTALVGIRAYDRPLGGMLASYVWGHDVLTGPNPQLPVVLDFFFPDSRTECFLVAMAIGFLVFSIRSAAFLWSRSRSRFVRLGGAVAAVFCPTAGFLDTSLVLISLVSVAGVTVLGVGMEFLYSRLSRRPMAAPSPSLAADS
jgi:hypothetical protein